ncbi:MAG: DUF1565 domain-containing protein, partial [Bacteroidetes bacterium]|nr:DUF1565 domain-containing protein [Bacteroidota bacterium]
MESIGKIKIIFNVVLFILLSTFANAKTIRVGANQPFQTITQAVTVANNGDTIIVSKGLYKEQNLIIDKEIVLKGIDLPVLDGEHKYEIISVKADNVVIDGFKIQNSGISSIVDIAGVKIYNKHHVQI